MSMPISDQIALHLQTIAEALTRLAPPSPAPAAFGASHVHIWRNGMVQAVDAPQRVPRVLLLGIEAQRDALQANTQGLAKGLPAANALLWGARGTGKSALVKAVHADVCAAGTPVILLEASADDPAAVAGALAALREAPLPGILFLDDVSLEPGDASLRALRPLLDGGVAGRPPGVVVYATSNRRHLVTRDPRENAADDMFWRDTAEERLALADRFGLHLGFHAIDQDTYLAMIRAYARHLNLPQSIQDLESAALLFARTRGQRSGRTAQQFFESQLTALGRPLTY